MGDLTEREAFLAMALFINDFFQRAEGNDLITLLADLTMLADGRPLDPASWEDWQNAVQRVKAGEQPPALDTQLPS
jgi:hypothetical protein